MTNVVGSRDNALHRHAGLDPASRLFFVTRITKGGWIYIMADQYRGTMYVGVTANLSARVFQHRSTFADATASRDWFGPSAAMRPVDCIAQEKRIKR